MYNNRKRALQFLEKSRSKHGDKYDYRKVNYVNSHTLVKIICPRHGQFKQQPKIHTQGSGCKYCSLEARMTSQKSFLQRCDKHFKQKYEYPMLQQFIKFTDFVPIVCPKHGEFKQRVNRHMAGHGCKKCGESKRTLTKEQFVKRAKRTHGDRYNYDNAKYKNIHTKVIITCPNHGPFNVSPALHIQRTGCPKCSVSHGHTEIRIILENFNISFVEEYRFDNCRSIYPLPFDFYIPSKNLLIEFDGIQHFRPIPVFGDFKIIKSHDKIKNKYASDNGLVLLRIKYDNSEIEQTIRNAFFS